MTFADWIKQDCDYLCLNYRSAQIGWDAAKADSRRVLERIWDVLQVTSTNFEAVRLISRIVEDELEQGKSHER